MRELGALLRRCFRPITILAFPPMRAEDGRELHEVLALEEADAWFEYLDTTRAETCSLRYDDIEPWAWARLKQRLRATTARRSQLRPAA